MEDKISGIDYLVEKLRNGAELNDELIQKSKQIGDNHDNYSVVKIKDYEPKIHMFLLAMQSVGIKVDYITADLVSRCLEVLDKKGGEMSLHDSVKIQISHKEYWREYFMKLKDE